MDFKNTNNSRYINKLIYRFIFWCVGCLYMPLAMGQIDSLAFTEWEKLFDPITTKPGYRIDFKCIVNGVGNPFNVDSAPEDCVSGFMHFGKDKYKIDFGVMKTVCDGKLLVLINEVDHTMLVDSMDKHRISADNILEELKKDSAMSHMGRLIMENKRFLNTNYQAVVATDMMYEEGDTTGVKLVTYLLIDDKKQWKHWIEYREELNEFTWFYIEKVGVDKRILDINITIPKHEIDQYAGYGVSDYRFLK